MARLVRVRVLRPVALWGRICGSGERLYLHELDALPLIASGHLEEVTPINGAARPWIEPTTR